MNLSATIEIAKKSNTIIKYKSYKTDDQMEINFNKN